MKFRTALFLNFCLFSGTWFPALCDNPIVTHIYAADPSAHVFEGRVYIYASHDKDDNDWFDMEDYHVYSSVDMVNWRDHGAVLHKDDVKWVKEYMWAPDCAFKNGTYYLYFPAKDSSDKFRIGVATSSNPAGPFIPEDQPIEGSFSIDPGVFIDDDGSAYMYFGGKSAGQSDGAYVAKLKENMKEFAADPQKINLNKFFEACWMNKINGRYYLSYSASNTIHYAIGDSPTGPFEHKGEVIGDVSGWTNHHSFAKYKDQWYAFYHTSDISGKTEQRSLSIDYLQFNEDSTFKKVVQTDESVAPVSYEAVHKSAMDTLQAENYKAHHGVHTKSIDTLQRSLFKIDNGDWLWYEALDFSQGASYAVLSYKSPGQPTNLSIRLDSLNGPILATATITPTSLTGPWQIYSVELNQVPTGIHDLYFTFAGGTESFELDWFKFQSQTVNISGTGSTSQNAMPLKHYDYKGRKISPHSPKSTQFIPKAEIRTSHPTENLRE